MENLNDYIFSNANSQKIDCNYNMCYEMQKQKTKEIPNSFALANSFDELSYDFLQD